MKKQKKRIDTRSQWVAQVALLLCSALWGASFIFTKDLFNNTPNITPTIIITGRLFVASLFFVPFMLYKHRLPRLRGKDLLFFLILAFFEPFLYSLLETGGVRYVSGSLSAIIIALIPLFTPFAMALVFKERLHLGEIMGIVLSLIGVGIMIIGPGFILRADPKGLLMLAGAVLIAILYTLVLSRVVERYHPLAITCYQNLIAFFYFLPLLLLREGDTLTALTITPRMISCIAFLGFFCSTIAYAGYNLGIRAVGVTRACAYNNLIPVFSLIIALAIGQESFSWLKVIGMSIVIGGLFLAQYHPNTDKTT